MIEVLETAHQAGRLALSEEAEELTPSLRQQFENWSQNLPRQITPSILYLALVSWAYVHGLVSLEMYNQFQGMVEKPEELYCFELKLHLQRIGLR